MCNFTIVIFNQILMYSNTQLVIVLQGSQDIFRKILFRILRNLPTKFKIHSKKYYAKNDEISPKSKRMSLLLNFTNFYWQMLRNKKQKFCVVFRLRKISSPS
jgi:hypothetical protein